MNQSCRYAKTCKCRMANGDMPHGCNWLDQKDCLSAKVNARFYFKDSLKAIHVQ